jgi:uncharacterized protein (TIGR02466 family)
MIRQIFPNLILDTDFPDWEICQPELLDYINNNPVDELAIDAEEFVNNKFICMNILDHCTETRKRVTDLINEYAEAANIKPLVIEDSWVTEYHKKEYIPGHTHLPKFVSGVIFIKQPQKGGMFYFNSPQHDLDNIAQHNHYKSFSPESERVHIINPREGQVIIFKSHMHHGTTPVYSDESRYALAFNVGVKK